MRYPVIGIAGLLITASTTAADVEYAITELGSARGYARGINEWGDVVGYQTPALYENQPFLYQNGVMTRLGTFGGSTNVARAINDVGDVVGGANSPGGSSGLATLWSGGAPVNLAPLGPNGYWANAYGVNGAGQIIGYTEVTMTDGRGFLYDHGVVTDLGTGAAYGINERGDITGTAGDITGYTPRQNQAFIYAGGVKTMLGTLGGATSEGHAINDLGQVTGWSTTASGQTRAFLYDNGVMTDLGTIGTDRAQAWDINNAGDVVGYTIGSQPEYRRAFIVRRNQPLVQLDSLIDPASSWSIAEAYGINDRGQIAVSANGPNGNFPLLLTPVSYLGDVNFDGRIDADDYALMDRGAAKGLGGWSNGDFGGNGHVGAEDYLITDQAFLGRGGVLSAAEWAERESRFGEAYVTALTASVPEPSLLAAGMLGIVGTARPSRRRRTDGND